MPPKSNRPPNGIPSQAEFGLLRAYLAQNGWTQQQIQEAIGLQPNGRTRQEITEQLIDYMKQTL